jgi:hypothetical protein
LGASAEEIDAPNRPVESKNRHLDGGGERHQIESDGSGLPDSGLVQLRSDKPGPLVRLVSNGARQGPDNLEEDAGACGCPKLCRGWSGLIPVVIDEAVGSGRSDDPSRHSTLGVGPTLQCWGSLLQGAVGPVVVVVIDVVDDEALHLVPVPDDGALLR